MSGIEITADMRTLAKKAGVTMRIEDMPMRLKRAIRSYSRNLSGWDDLDSFIKIPSEIDAMSPEDRAPYLAARQIRDLYSGGAQNHVPLIGKSGSNGTFGTGGQAMFAEGDS